MEINKIIHGDCLEVMKGISENSIDMIITDPPYFISKEVKITRGDKTKFKGKDINLDFGAWDKQWQNERDYWNWTFRWINECVRVLKPGRIFATWFDRDKINFISCYLQKRYHFKAKGYFAMIKSNPVPQARKVKFMNGWEIIGLWQKPGGKLVFNYQLGQQPDYAIVPVVGHTTKEDGERIHPTQKPIKIVKLLLSYWTNPGDIVLDPFAGSGTTAIACYLTGRNFICIENDENFVIKARQRFDEFKAQARLNFEGDKI